VNAVAATTQAQLEQTSGKCDSKSEEQPDIKLIRVNPDYVEDGAEQDEVVHDGHQVHADPSAAKAATAVFATAATLEAYF
jgi:hypothetical protein